jgi:lyso-ornithine lipid O-acyltransferase
VVLDTLLAGSFVTKAEVAGWPVFGLLAKLQRSVFIERRPQRTATQRDAMRERIAVGDSLILFAEGTSSDGLRLRPFKSSFLALAEQPGPDGRPLTVQPVTVAYARLNGLPVGRRSMPVFAWVGDEDLAPHLWRFLKAGPGEAVVVFHPPVTLEQFGSRKALTRHCERVVAAGLSAVNSGRRTGPKPASAVGAPTPQPALASQP